MVKYSYSEGSLKDLLDSDWYFDRDLDPAEDSYGRSRSISSFDWLRRKDVPGV